MATGGAAADRRSRRRGETIQEILRVAIEVMAADGVAALSLSEVARRIGIQPPSLYKYFPSRLAVYDALFADGSRRVLAEFRAGAAAADPGLPALFAGLERFAAFILDQQVLGQLLFWRPVPGFVPSPEAFEPAQELATEVRTRLTVAAALGQIHPDAASEEGQALLTVLVGGVLSQQAANEPGAGLATGRFARLLPRVLQIFADTYRPERSAP
jgi:AcrR family transcriptional regulator